ncbi:MAG: SpoIIE family protein phosphatase [Ardenticatenaceae bacterium]|nr:SpoIIE family protein phosphatase [Ardenticatenaceae bacterium]MCB9443596.1 SpoIIE family protein phosphatase [Ardenticatenaceae bacterium]
MLTNGLTWPTISFAVLVASLLLSAYILYRRYRSRQILMERVQELETLSAAGRAIVAAELDVAALCELIASESGHVIDNSTFQVGLFEDNLYHILFWRINGRIQPTPQTFDLSDNSGVVGWLRQTKKPLLVRDFQKEIHNFPVQPRYISDTPPRSAIFIPLISGEIVTGIVAAQSLQPNRFDEEDLRRLMILANQAAAAITQAQLYERERRRAAHLELVGKIARQINLLRDREEIFTQVVHLTRETFGFHPVTIFSIDPPAGRATAQASSAPELVELRAQLPPGEGLVGLSADQRETILANNTADDPHFIQNFEMIDSTATAVTKSELVIPLMVAGEVLGVLDVQSPKVGAFSSAERTALEALAAEVAIAIDQARQLAWQREQAWLTTAQFQVAQALGESADLDEVLTAVTRLTPMLVGVDCCGILLWDAETAIYRGGMLYGRDSETATAFANLRLTVGDWGALDAVHIGQEPITSQKRPPWVDKKQHKQQPPEAITLFPIHSKEQNLGVLLVGQANHDQPEDSSPLTRRQELLDNIITQAAQAIESAYLRLAQQEEAWVNTALLQVAEAVNSLFDLNEILDTIVRLVPLLVGVESTLILIWDEDREAFYAGPSYGLSKMGQGLLTVHEIELDEFLTVRQQPADFLTPTATYYSLTLPRWLATSMSTKTAHAFPLNARGNRVGLMLVGNKPGENGRSFSTRRLNILNGIAHQAATAVVNNHLYKEAAERDRLEQELNVAREIQASLIPNGSPAIPGCEVASFWQAARQVSGDFYDFIPLSGDRWGIVVADVADKGVPAALFMAMSRTILRTVAFNRDDPAAALIRTNEIIESEAQSDLFVTVFYAIWDPATQILTYANGGHNPPILLRNNGKIRLLQAGGMALGVLPDIEVESQSVQLYPHDTVLFYTDGVTEAMNEDYDEFGMERLRLTAVNHKNQSATNIKQAITDAIRNHAGDTPQFDDITLIVMKRTS